MGHGHATSGQVFHEVDRLAHVSVDVIELEQSVGSVVEVGIVTSRQNIPSLARSATIFNLVAAIKLQLGAVNRIELKLRASEGSNVCSGHGCIEFRLTLYRVVCDASGHLKLGTSEARIG